MTDTDRFADALTVARHFDEDAFACDFGGRTAINLPNLDAVISLAQPAAPAEGLEPLDGVDCDWDENGKCRCQPAAPAEGLDVERLARALMRAIPVPASYEEWQATIDRSYYDDAAAIAREYAAIKEAS
jgi:hypothetical protein